MNELVSDWLNSSEIIDKKAIKPCHRLHWCPYGKLIEEFPVREQESKYTCKIFQHDCPVFYHIEKVSEDYSVEDYEKDIKDLFNRGGLSEVFLKDRISEYWYQIGSAHSDDDNSIKLKYAIEKITEGNLNLKDTFLKFKKIIESVTLDEVYQWNSNK